MSISPHELTVLLEAAADNLEGAQRNFFQALLDARVFIALQPGFQRPNTVTALGGKEHISSLGYATIDYQGSTTLPIFSEEHFVGDWAESEIVVVEQEFKKLLWLLDEDTWLYLNPAQNVGKEITPWEIEQLKKGPESIGDLVAALNDNDDHSDIIIREDVEAFSEFKKNILPILQIYPELEEAFLVGMQESAEGDVKPTLGIRYNDITEAKRLYLRSEFENASKNFLQGHEQLFLVDDLDNKNSSNWRLFDNSTPFYIAQKSSGARPESRLTALFTRISKLFRGESTPRDKHLRK